MSALIQSASFQRSAVAGLCALAVLASGCANMSETQRHAAIGAGARQHFAHELAVP